MNHEANCKAFNVTSVSRADLQSLGFDASGVPDSTMAELAGKLADDYCDQLFWGSLEILADYLHIPRRRTVAPRPAPAPQI